MVIIIYFFLLGLREGLSFRDFLFLWIWGLCGGVFIVFLNKMVRNLLGLIWDLIDVGR